MKNQRVFTDELIRLEFIRLEFIRLVNTGVGTLAASAQNSQAERKAWGLGRKIAAEKKGCLRERYGYCMDGIHRPEEKGLKIIPGVTLSFQDYVAEQIVCSHAAEKECLEINYCRNGRIGWTMKDGRFIYLGPGDFCIHTRSLCAGSRRTISNGHFEGFSLCIDVKKFEPPLALFEGSGITGQMLAEKFCYQSGFSEKEFHGEDYAVFFGNEKTKAIFDGFYHKSEAFQRNWFVLKTLELFLYLMEVDGGQRKGAVRCRPEQVETVREAHEYLLRHMDKRITIEELSQKYLMNPTTMKAVFKEVYGESLASHMKEHRMERAASLLSETDDSIARIAGAVGYGSQSRFSTAFKEVYQMLPLEYRKAHAGKDAEARRRD